LTFQPASRQDALQDLFSRIDADGATVAMTVPAASGASAMARASYDFSDRLIQRQANVVAAQTGSSLSVRV
jgi:hypothetical protein